MLLAQKSFHDGGFETAMSKSSANSIIFCQLITGFHVYGHIITYGNYI